MGREAHEVVGVVFDDEVKPPVAGDTGLPEALRLIVFLRPEGRVPEVLKQKRHLFV